MALKTKYLFKNAVQI